MKTFRYTILASILMLALVLSGAASAAEAPDEGPIELIGSLDGAPYKILVPANWNGTLLVYAHSYSATPYDEPFANFGFDVGYLDPGLGKQVEGALLERGYALAGSSFRAVGWTVKEGIHDTLALTGFFNGHVGKPKRVILYGASSGGLITAASIEKFPGIYDAGIPMCGIGAGATRNIDKKLDVSLAYDVAFGWPPEWGSVENVRDDLDFGADVFPIYLEQISDPANFGYFEFMRLVNRLPLQGYYDTMPGLTFDMFIATQLRGELEARAGGPVAQNRDHVYTLTAAEKGYLANLGVDADALLNEMNARTNIDAHRPARLYLERYADLDGNIERPVLSLHTTVDILSPAAHVRAYRETVTAAGNQEYLVEAYTNGIVHCAFTVDQLVKVIEATEYWLDTGTPPGPEFFPEALGFVHGFEPPPWPQPPQ